MKTQAVILIFLYALVPTAHADIVVPFGSGANQFSMTFVPVGNPGNPADTTGEPSSAGSVSYQYNIGKYEVSREMVVKANSSGALGITMANMTLYGGNGLGKPASGVSWNEAARFVNWLNTSQGHSAAYKFSTQPGQMGYVPNENIQLWLTTDAGYNAENQFRNSQARYFLPTMDEWYKAAYYDPIANGGAGGYRRFPTGSDSIPAAVAFGTSAGTAVRNQPVNQGPADVSNAGGLSSYGAMGMGGNVWEWEESEFDLVNDFASSARTLRGGDWRDVDSSIDHLAKDFRRLTSNPTNGNFNYGFRVASVPEPSSYGLLVLASVGLCQRRSRRR